METKKYINHSGGAEGADICWETEGKLYGVKTISYSFYNHIQHGENPKILTSDELSEGYEHCKIAEKSLNRPLNRIVYPYVKNLISRNWFQVKNSNAIFAIGTFQNKTHKLVNGGTGWAVQMAIDNKKDVFFFNQKISDFGSRNHCWFKYNYDINKFESYSDLPILTENFAGIGSRDLNEFGKLAIIDVYNYNFNGKI